MLLDKRVAFKPNEYDVFYKLGKLVVKTHWHDELMDFITDKQQFHNELTETERYIIGTILKTFAQTETVVMDEFWGHVHNFIPKPEFKVMAYTFAENECRHAEAYDRLSTELGLSDYHSFLEDEVAKERLENLTKIKIENGENPNIVDLARTFAIFGGGCENVALFAQFAIMLSFSQRGLLSDLGTVIAWSQKDETLHAISAMTTFNILLEEYPDKVTREEIKDDILDGLLTTYRIEVDLVKQIFAKGSLPNIDEESVVEMMKDRVNQSLTFMKFEPHFEVNKEIIKKLDWFVSESFGLEMTDFFWSKPVEYTMGETQYNASSLF